MLSPTEVFIEVSDIYEELFTKLADPRVQSWPLMKSPFPFLTIITIYILIVKYGPRLMRDKEPFDLKWFIIPYNAVMVGISIYLLYGCATTAVAAKYSIICQTTDRSTNPLALKMARLIWLCFVSKLIEMLESFVFILRKKNKQLSFLHVYHHTITAVYCWGGAKYISGGSAYVPIVMNSFVHTFMYLYYALAAFGPKMQKYLWWKRYLTTLQLIQFFLIVTLAAGNFLMPCSDERIRNFASIGGAYTISLAGLFLHFYRKTYTGISNVVKNGKMEITKNK